MTKTLFGKMYHGALFINNGKNYLIDEVIDFDDESEIIRVYLVNAECDFDIFVGSYTEFHSKVVK
jgi:hypothetical protein